MKNQKSIVIFSTPLDSHAAAVSAELLRLGIRPILLDLTAFPRRLSLSMNYSGGRCHFAIRENDRPLLDFADVESAWWRRPQRFSFPAEISDPDVLRFVDAEARMAFEGLYLSAGIRWMNPPHRDIVAAQKPYQLALAQKVGLTIPETLITNDPEAALEFKASFPGGIVHKQFVALSRTWRETRLVDETDLQQHLDGIKVTPVQFQEKIAAVSEVRAIVVDNEIFAGEARFDNLSYRQDIRMNMDAKYTKCTLPADIAGKVRDLMSALGLVYGAIDFLVKADGEWCFLEVNPTGQYLYIEQRTDQPISSAIAAWLGN